jgi:hypothetical protein
MKLPFRRAGLAAVAAIGLACGGTATLWAGGSMDDDEPADQGPSYFGFVRDTRGVGVAEAKVSAEVKDRGSLITHSNVLGSYKISGFGTGVDPKEVMIACAKDGYKQVDVIRRTLLAAGVVTVETDCTLQKL